MTNREPEFYRLMGPYLSRREIVNELGFPVWDEDNKIWFVLLDGERVAAFSALRSETDHGVFCSAYVLPVYRRRGAYRRMVAERIAHAKARGLARLTTTATEHSLPALEQAGFVPGRTMGRYTKMELSL